MTRFTAQQARMLGNLDLEKEYEDIILAIKTSIINEHYQSAIFTKKRINPIVRSMLEEDGYEVMHFPSISTQKDGIYDRISWE